MRVYINQIIPVAELPTINETPIFSPVMIGTTPKVRGEAANARPWLPARVTLAFSKQNAPISFSGVVSAVTADAGEVRGTLLQVGIVKDTDGEVSEWHQTVGSQIRPRIRNGAGEFGGFVWIVDPATEAIRLRGYLTNDIPLDVKSVQSQYQLQSDEMSDLEVLIKRGEAVATSPEQSVAEGRTIQEVFLNPAPEEEEISPTAPAVVQGKIALFTNLDEDNHPYLAIAEPGEQTGVSLRVPSLFVFPAHFKTENALGPGRNTDEWYFTNLLGVAAVCINYRGHYLVNGTTGLKLSDWDNLIL